MTVKASKNVEIPQFHKKALVAAITAGLTALPSYSNASNETKPLDKWGTNSELMFYNREGGNFKLGLRGLIPLWQDSSELSYLDLRLIDGRGKVDEGNIALGHRWYNSESQKIIGVYSGFDIRRSSSNLRHRQLTLGGEILGKNYDFIANYYHPLSDEKLTGIDAESGFFSGNSLYTAGIYEQALKGYDLEVGKALNFGSAVSRFEPRAYAKYYSFDGNTLQTKDDGFGLRFTARPQQNIMMELAWEEDKLRGSQTSLTFTYSFGANSDSRPRRVRERMTEFHQRDIDIRETSQVDNSLRSSNSEEHRVSMSKNVVHIDNSAVSNGDGSAERPYNNIANCLPAKCRTGDIIYIHTGAADYTDEIHIKSGQKLIGQGYKFYGIGGDQAPVIRTTGDSVEAMGGNIEIAGLTIHSDGDAIYADEVDGKLYIHNNTLTADDNAINIYNEFSNEKEVSNILKENNNYTAGRDVIQIEEELENAASHQSQIAILNNSLTGLGNRAAGIELKLVTKGNNTQTHREVFIANNIIGTDEDGIIIYGADAENGAYISDSLTIQNNQIAVEEEGIYLGYAYAHGAQSKLERTVKVSHNTIQSNDGNGIEFANSEVEDGGQLTESLSVANNIITAKNSGIAMGYLYADGLNSELTRTVLIDSNTISNHSFVGINVGYSESENGGVINHSAVVSNNTIQSANQARGDGNVGIRHRSQSIDDGSLNQEDISLLNNTVSSMSYAMELQVYADGGKASSHYNIANNTLNSNGDDAILIENDTNLGQVTSVAEFSADITNNTIVADGDGISLYNEQEDSFATMNIFISDNHVTSTDDGVFMNSDVADQVVKIKNNTFDSGDDDVNNAGAGVCEGDDCP